MSNTRFRLMRFAVIFTILAAFTPQVLADLTVSALRNAEYFPVVWNTPEKLDRDGKIKLVNGEYENYGQDSGGIELLSLEQVALGDLNGDGHKDGAAILYHNTGGSGCVAQVAAIIDVNGQPRHVASRNLGDRTEIKALTIKGGRIVVKLDNPRFFPGQGKTVTYRLIGSQLKGPEPFK